jgi:hypothetical protein
MGALVKKSTRDDAPLSESNHVRELCQRLDRAVAESRALRELIECHPVEDDWAALRRLIFNLNQLHAA